MATENDGRHHQYPTVDDESVWAMIERDMPILWRECVDYLQHIGPANR